MDPVLQYVFAIVILILSLVILNNLKHLKHRVTRGQKPPGPWGFPIVGHLPLFGAYLPDTFDQWRRKYGDVFRIRMGSWDAIVINGYSTIKDALEKRGDAFASRPCFLATKVLTKDREHTLGFGPFTPAYVLHRKIVTSALRAIIDGKNADTNELILAEGNKLVDELLAMNGAPCNIDNAIRVTISRIIYHILYTRSQDINEEDFTKWLHNQEEFGKYLANGNLIDLMPWLRFIMPWKLREILKLIYREESLARDIVEERKSQRTGGAETVTDIFLDFDLPDKITDKYNCVSKKRVLTSLSELAFSGVETTHGLLEWLILYMIKYPSIQRKIQNEIDETIGRRQIETTDRSKLNYTWATVLEVMRITSNVPFALPRSAVADTEINGYRIDKDTFTMVNLHSIHMDREFWKDPEAFRPDRFLNEDKSISKEMMSHVVTFGLGRRKCVGEHLAKMNIFLIFTLLMQRCSFSKVEGELISTEPTGVIVFLPKPFRVVVKERYSNTNH